MQKEGITSPKDELRATIRARLDKFSLPERETGSAAILIHLISLLRNMNKEDAETVLLIFANLSDEPSLLGLFESGNEERLALVFPKVETNRKLSLWRVRNESEFSVGYAGIREPDPNRCEELKLEQIDGIVVPGVAFDPDSGARLGRGGGFYDRLLGAPSKIPAIGVCFGCQLYSPIPMESHDRFVQAVVTETGIHQCARPGGEQSG